MELIFCCWIFLKEHWRNDVGSGEGGSGDDETTAEKRRHFFKGKNRVTPSVLPHRVTPTLVTPLDNK